MTMTIQFKSQGEDTTIYPQAKIMHPEKIILGHSVIIDDFVLLIGAEGTRIESFSHIGAHSSITGGGVFEMRGFTGMSQGCRILTGHDTHLAIPTQYRQTAHAHVILEKHAHLGAGCTVLPGVTVAEGTYVGANSLVTSDTEPWSLYVGSPARKIKARPKATILELEQACLAKCFDADGKYLSWHQET